MPRMDYDARQAARQERLEARADKLTKASAAAFKKGDDMFSIIPFGQPILVGHYSEGRDRRYRARAAGQLDKGVMLAKEAGNAAAAAASIGTGGVSSDDPNGIEKLTEKLAGLEAKQAKMQDANKAVRKGDRAALIALGFTAANAEQVCTVPVWGTKLCAFEPYQLQNNGATIRATKARIEQLKAAATVETKTIETNLGFEVIENAEANRVQIIFPGKPDEATRTILKGAGFRWSPSEGAWQRLLNNGARWAAQRVIAELTPKEAV